MMQVMTPGMQMGGSGMGMQMSMESPGMDMQMGMMPPGAMSSDAASPSALTPSVSPLQTVSQIWYPPMHIARAAAGDVLQGAVTLSKV